VQRFPVSFSAFHSYLTSKSLTYLQTMRVLLGLSYLHILIEHYLDSSFVRVTSSTKLFGLGYGTAFANSFAGLLNSDNLYHGFIAGGVLLTVLFIWNRFSLIVPVVLYLFQQLFLTLNSGNMYGHELFFQHFFVLLMIFSFMDYFI